VVFSKGIIYYTDNRLEEPIYSKVQKLLSESGLPITSVSLKPIGFGNNIVVNFPPGITTMVKQILSGLEASKEDIIFFAEHDVLYHKSHWDFVPPREDTFYYNVNNWRWDYPTDRLITYDHLRSLSGICAHRELLLNHYRVKMKLIKDNGWQDTSREPEWARKLGHEPGKSRSIPAKIEEWRAENPNIDIRHNGTITKRKCRLVDFKHQPINWQEIKIKDLPQWNSQLLSLLEKRNSCPKQ
jgi:hypothetical protein